MTSVKKQLATVCEPISYSGTNITILLNCSINIMIVLYPLSSGSLVTKSMWTYSHGICGTGNG